MLENNMNNFEGLHTNQNRLTDPKSDRDLLMDLYNATNGLNGERKTNWGGNKPISEWEKDLEIQLMDLYNETNGLNGERKTN
ncbi:MAG: hypothetical protein ERJ67_01040 [Aphanocapsa feldmannii 277cV]|uniref:Uncharacterized protein n=1 Tax=Aphanocapsa feldmannii 277cV TaxID=2507553 RepID=A0A524RQV1_9CHRO|nr:MAG: hypothetical protein ERJ67_01040 [Aphanocapsa feldmannii 277cV]